jgi:hypothetical protein
MSSFHVDGRVSIKLEYDLAMRIGDFILSSGTEDKQFLALGHKLLNLDEEETDTPKFPKRRDYYQEKEIIRSAGKILKKVENNDYAHFQEPVQNSWEAAEKKMPIKIRSTYSKNI